MSLYNKTGRESVISTRAALTANRLWEENRIMAALSLTHRARRLKSAFSRGIRSLFRAVLRA